MLVVMCGLPGAGKSTIADELGRRMGWPVLGVDPTEAAMTRAGIRRSTETGLAAYVVVGALTDHLLGLGQCVIVDAVNDAVQARQQWIELGTWHQVSPVFVEVICSDAAEHRRRLESRRRSYGADFEPRWEDLEPRRALLTTWADERVVLDSLAEVEANVARVIELIVGSAAAPGERPVRSAPLDPAPLEPPSPAAEAVDPGDGVALTP